MKGVMSSPLFCSESTPSLTAQTLLIHTDNRNTNRNLLDKTYYQCSTYRKKGANFCTAHRISAGDIENALKADIDRHAVKAMKDKEKFINNVLLSMNEGNVERSEKVKAEIDRLKKRNAELDRIYIRLYEDYSGGKLSEKKFTMMSAHYEQEQDANEENCQNWKGSIKKSLPLLSMRNSLQRALHSAQA